MPLQDSDSQGLEDAAAEEGRTELDNISEGDRSAHGHPESQMIDMNDNETNEELAYKDAKNEMLQRSLLQEMDEAASVVYPSPSIDFDLSGLRPVRVITL